MRANDRMRSNNSSNNNNNNNNIGWVRTRITDHETSINLARVRSCDDEAYLSHGKRMQLEKAKAMEKRSSSNSSRSARMAAHRAR